MLKLSRGDLVCLIPHSDYHEDPVIGQVLEDWDYWIHGERAAIYWFDGETFENDPAFIQKLEDFGKTTF